MNHIDHILMFTNLIILVHIKEHPYLYHLSSVFHKEIYENYNKHHNGKYFRFFQKNPNN